MVDSSFYADGEVYDAAVVETNDHPGSTLPSQSPSSFYPAGNLYDYLGEESAVIALLQQLAATTTTNANAASYSASQASTSASQAATSAAAAAGAVQAAAGTLTPAADFGSGAIGTSGQWAHADHVHPTDTSRAPLNSPGFTGTPTAPMPAVNDNSSRLATTAFLQQQGAVALPAMDGTAVVGTALKWARQDHVHPTDTSRASVTYVDTQDALKAPLASPAFTGAPTAPTPTAGDNSTKIATTAFVLANGGSGSSGGHGQCRLGLSGGNLQLLPRNGNKLIVNGVTCTVPDAGVTLAATGLTADTTYCIYATASAGVVNALEASTTWHATSSTGANKGVEIKSGDDARTLVGMARCVAGPAWVDSSTQALVVSYFQRGSKGIVNHLTATRSTSSTTFVELHSEIRCEFLTWADEAVLMTLSGTGYPSVANIGHYFGIAFDGSTPEDGLAGISDGTGGAQRPVAATSFRRLAEGYHYGTAVAAVDSGGTANLYYVTNANGRRSALTVTVRG